MPEHYLWFDDDPFAPPPAEQDYISDINTGRSYRETHKKLITKPDEQILCPVPLYLDGAATGQFVNNPIIAVKIALRMHTRKGREQGLFWGTIGCIPSPTKVKSKGQRQLVDSGHADGAIPYYEMMDDEGELKVNNTKNGKAPVHSAQDLHAMPDVMLASLVKLFKTRLKWNLVYKGEVHKNIELVFLCPSLGATLTRQTNFAVHTPQETRMYPNCAAAACVQPMNPTMSLPNAGRRRPNTSRNWWINLTL